MVFRFRDTDGITTIASIAPLNDGTFLELVRDFQYQREKRIFQTKQEWLDTLPLGAIISDMIGSMRIQKPVVVVEPVDENLKDLPYLLALKQRYGIRPKPNPKKMNSLNKQLELTNSDFAKNAAMLQDKKNPYRGYAKLQDGLIKTRIEKLEAQIAANPAIVDNPTYVPLFMKNATAFVQKDGRMLPLAYHTSDHVMIFEGKTGITFQELDLPDRPELWMQKGQRRFKAV
jgi:hypothetical protein